MNNNILNIDSYRDSIIGNELLLILDNTLLNSTHSTI